MNRLTIIVGGFIGLYPTGGATWDYVQYPLGLKLMGHDVYYIEDTNHYPVYQKSKLAWNDATDCIRYLESVMNYFQMSDAWAYRDVATGKTFGMSEKKVREVCSRADVFINISCSTMLREEYMNIPCRVLIDSDPMFTQIQYEKELNSPPKENTWSIRDLIENHNYLFTFGENINSENCLIPTFNRKWISTRQPVCLNLWNNNSRISSLLFTTVMNWSERKILKYNNIEWGQKDIQFIKYQSVPSCIKDVSFKAIINHRNSELSNIDIDNLKSSGWEILSPDMISNPIAYKNFIVNSSAEFSVAKETYVKSNSGWFSCRSACYLAAGKPVIAEETSWSKFIPAGEGLFSFNSVETAVESIEKVRSDYAFHSKRASEIAREYFDHKIVLDKLLAALN